MEKYPSLATAKIGIVNEKIDKQMCQVYHTPILKKFSNESHHDELMLPAAVNHLKHQKSHLLKMADTMGMSVKSQFKNGNLVVQKEPEPVVSNYKFLQLAPSSISLLAEDVKNVHLDVSGDQDRYLSSGHSDKKNIGRRPEFNRCAGHLTISDNPPSVSPYFGECAEFVRHRRGLPIYQYRQQILDQLVHQQVVIITGEVGSGKTTQVPQYILENANEKNIPCRIVSIQTRRISALAASERVTAERGICGEKVVGHQIRLESRGTMNCPLMFCTTGVFLRTLMEGERCLRGMTHIIVDQAHDRDRHTDLLLAFFRLRLNFYPNLRLILLSASGVSQILASYFHVENIIHIPVPSKAISEFFLEDALAFTKFLAKRSFLATNTKIISPSVIESATYLDDLLTEAWFNGSDAVFQHLMELVYVGTMSIDYQHSQTGITLLMASAIHGKIDIVKAAISSGANPTFQLKGMTPYDLANEFARPAVADLLHSYAEVFNAELGRNVKTSEPLIPINPNSTDDMVKSFYAKYSEDHANLDLIMEVLSFVQDYSQAGAILVFLPAYSEVIELRDMIATSTSSLKDKLEVLTLHSHLAMSDFRKLFLSASPNKRKVILSTNIAETSVYFEDVACVIDSGLIRDKETDVIFSSPGKTNWIAKASAVQRSMHVRHGGLVIRLYPRSRFESFQEYSIPEITRDSLIDVCIPARLIIPDDVRLPQFFCSFPDSPPTTSVHTAVEILQSIDALDANHKVTEVGWRLIDLPVDPRLAKMVLVATGLKCLDPVLSIVSCLARDDPFITPSSPDERKQALSRKHALAADSFSDHMAYLKAYHLWEKANDEGRKRQVCQENYLSVANLELIFFLRVLLVGELRAAGYIKTRGSCDIRNLNIHAESWPAIKAALTAGLYPNLARYSPIDGNITTHHQTPSQFHFASTLLVQEGRSNESVTSYSASHSYNLGTQKQSGKPPSIATPMNPWVIFGDQQRAGQYTILKCCTAITPITAMLFAGHWASPIQMFHLNQNDLKDVQDRWDEDDYDSDEMDEEEIRTICQNLHFQHVSNEVVGLNRVIRQNKKAIKPHKKFVILRLNEFVGFIVDSYTAQLIMAIRHKFQSILVKGIRDPGRNTVTAEEAVLRTVLSILSSEEMSMQLVQPSNIGRRPANVSADSMLVVPKLNPGELFQVKRYLTYTPPPKGFIYDAKEQGNDGTRIRNRESSTNVLKAPLNEPQSYDRMPTAAIEATFSTGISESSHGYRNTFPSPFPANPPPVGRPILKSYCNMSRFPKSN